MMNVIIVAVTKHSASRVLIAAPRACWKWIRGQMMRMLIIPAEAMILLKA